MSIEERIKDFRADLPQHDVADLVRRHITSGDCFTLSPNLYYELKARIAENFGIHPTEVVVVGSAELGFSIAPDKRYRQFGETSDIDVALCSAYSSVDSMDFRGDPESAPSRYYKAALQATNDRSSRVARGEIIRMILEPSDQPTMFT
jgi:hypothetical protein